LKTKNGKSSFSIFRAAIQTAVPFEEQLAR
jgi:hypothetical protein